MVFKAGILLMTLLVGSLALPLNGEQDNSIFFENTIVNPLIIGGVASPIVPHMVALSSGVMVRSFFCGASLISDKHVLTAAHCIRSVLSGGSVTSSVRGKIGSVSQSFGGSDYSFSQGAIHPDYNNNLIKNDIGYLITSSPVVFGNNVKPVALSFDFVGGDVPTIVNGWGRTVVGGPASPVLRELRPITVDGEQCVKDVARRGQELNRPNTPPVDPEVEVCTYLGANSGMCHGDSGSALVDLRNNKQIGIVSWGLPCARGAPDMFARVSAYQSWLQQILN
ncbi:serine protease 33 [Danaus plexippus plexippus]|uniref:Serine protease 33 n=1 Tax=Danaus plexippus plexippus TaxID=278856 RepID=A0A212FIQ7_DANPL|nr:serine protease 33 [Danaus plexippus plexippus]